MSAWIESHQSLSRHRKTLRAVALLKIDRHHFIGHMHELWWWGLDNVPMDGWLNSLSDEEIAAGAQWEGDAGDFVRALVAAGFIDVDPNGERWLHDWFQYAGKLLKKRADNAERMREARAMEAQRIEEERAEHVQDTCGARAGATEPNRTQQNRTEPETDSAASAASPPISKTCPSEVGAQVAEVWAYYKQHIQPRARVCPESKIRTRLKKFDVAELKDAIDHFRARYWYMAKCSDKGGEWFFDSDGQIDKFLLVKPQTREQYEAEQRGHSPNGRDVPRPRPDIPTFVAPRPTHD